ncbi:MAG: transcription antitermination factor NusB [Leptolyngbya sp. IPPAS B-1204]|uniref:Transcription antitermination protein NusB n=1 Tax=Leptolyngbya sp. NK1-12 TaxID=2547451 RepID=A0AA96WHU6_9CYAN|nr:transcription antitermination factor NusB [Leptolyngbya sp. NK1-12]MBF2050814.1 transcription antitermination protein NusB [Elainella sp. C42_A2020_010]RNJ67384.1 MAG: transcription antitermination protein NusB [Leptolyngbya sp. IPPAS B-1204]WNZ25384.1 transcription antitermination protein NusB [Leptolyngbya sp. NK1-12]
MQARRIARELALLSIGQLPAKPDKLQAQPLQDVILAAVRTLTTEVQDTLEAASAELSRSSDRLLNSETRAGSINSARAMVNDAIDLTQTAINRVGAALELPEFIQLANQKEVRAYTMELLTQTQAHREEIDRLLNQSMVDWQLHRLARIDQDILRLAVTEMWLLGVPEQVAINEAVELAKRYSGEEGYRFLNGVLRRVSEQINGQAESNNSQDEENNQNESNREQRNEHLRSGSSLA